jgi:alpha-beta hydrolase superfamily lysophospholipase
MMPNKTLSGFKAFKMVFLNVCITLFALVHTNTINAQNTLNLSVPEGIAPLISNDSVHCFKINGEKIFYRKWGASCHQENLRVLLVLHGIGFHSFPYRKIFNFIEKDSILVYAMDLPGHGLSGNPRGVIQSNEGILEAIDGMISVIQKDNSDSETFLVGSSMGGIYALAYAIRDSISPHLSGLVLAGPALRVHRSQIINFSNLLYIYPFLFNRQKPVVYLDGKRLECSTSDQEYIDARRNDSLSVHYISMDYLLKVLEVQGICRRKSLLAGVSVPTLIMHGGEDKISSIKGSGFLNRNMLNSRTELIIYPKSKHSIFWDSDSIRAVRDMINWISKN